MICNRYLQLHIKIFQREKSEDDELGKLGRVTGGWDEDKE